jgi:hypothetical protein
MVVPSYHWPNFAAVGGVDSMVRFLFLFCGVLGALFAIEMLKPVQEVSFSLYGLLAAEHRYHFALRRQRHRSGRILRDAHRLCGID